MVNLAVVTKADRDGMTLRTRAQRVAAQHKDVEFYFVEVGSSGTGQVLVNGVDTLPALMAGEKVVSQGSVPKISEIEKLVEKALAETPATGNTEKKTRSDRKREGIPQCTGCGRACYLNEPGCRVGIRKAKELGFELRQ